MPVKVKIYHVLDGEREVAAINAREAVTRDPANWSYSPFDENAVAKAREKSGRVNGGTDKAQAAKEADPALVASAAQRLVSELAGERDKARQEAGDLRREAEDAQARQAALEDEIGRLKGQLAALSAEKTAEEPKAKAKA